MENLSQNSNNPNSSYFGFKNELAGKQPLITSNMNNLSQSQNFASTSVNIYPGKAAKQTTLQVQPVQPSQQAKSIPHFIQEKYIESIALKEPKEIQVTIQDYQTQTATQKLAQIISNAAAGNSGQALKNDKQPVAQPNVSQMTQPSNNTSQMQHADSSCVSQVNAMLANGNGKYQMFMPTPEPLLDDQFNEQQPIANNLQLQQQQYTDYNINMEEDINNEKNNSMHLRLLPLSPRHQGFSSSASSKPQAAT